MLEIDQAYAQFLSDKNREKAGEPDPGVEVPYSIIPEEEARLTDTEFTPATISTYL